MKQTIIGDNSKKSVANVLSKKKQSIMMKHFFIGVALMILLGITGTILVSINSNNSQVLTTVVNFISLIFFFLLPYTMFCGLHYCISRINKSIKKCQK
jgi:hypothetical protein